MDPVRTDVGRVVRNVAIVRLVVLVGVPLLLVVLLACFLGLAMLIGLGDAWQRGAWPTAVPTAASR